MAEHSIIFSGPMVRAVLEGRKTQTRRIVKITHRTPGLAAALETRGFPSRPEVAAELCPYGKPGDRLWVREAWKTYASCNGESAGELEQRAIEEEIPVRHYIPRLYLADGFSTDPIVSVQNAGRYRHPRFMPRWASRITLGIAGVRVERLRNISEPDAAAEGADPMKEEVSSDPALRYRAAFHSLWSSIHGLDSWAANPWVWVLSFKNVSVLR